MSVNRLLKMNNLEFLIPKHSASLVRLGSKNDGGYLIPENFKNNQDNLLTFGLGLNWDFEKDFFFNNPQAVVVAFDKSIYPTRLCLRSLKSFFIRNLNHSKIKEFKIRINILLDYLIFWVFNRHHSHKNRV